MTSEELDELVKKAEALRPDEQLLLIAHLADRIRENYQIPKQRRKWGEICGTVPYPLVGEDAQVWVSQTRLAGDKHREKQ